MKKFSVIEWIGIALVGITLVLLYPFVAIALVTIAVGWFLINSKNTKKAKDVRGEIAEIIGNSKFIHIEKDTVIALNQAQKEILLGKVGLMKKYPYADIREWTVKEQTAGVVVGMNFTSTLAAAGANLGAQQSAMANTGLFVRVRDIDNPEWRVSMMQKADRNRWFEILTQEINEGGMAA